MIVVSKAKVIEPNHSIVFTVFIFMRNIVSETIYDQVRLYPSYKLLYVHFTR